MGIQKNNEKIVLVIEDNRRLNDINCRALQSEGFITLSALTLAAAREHLANSSPDAIVLDIMMPDGNGVEFCKEIREKTAAPILFLTAVKGYKEAMLAIAAGGDDYLNKPFDIHMLIAKVQAFMRRDDISKRIQTHNKEQPQEIINGTLKLDIIAARAFLEGEDLNLSPKEFSLLYYMVQHENESLSTEILYQIIWKQPMQENNQAIKSVISRLRKKLENSDYTINAHRGEGYRFEKS